MGLRFVYGLFCIALVVVVVLAASQAGPRPSERLMIGLIGAGVWFGVSIAIAVLLYVTRAGRVERVAGAVKTA
ncbi:hypothetical protein BC361_07990 [Ensifer sp. LC54]|nr:hypothetical protein BC361_07990 [Ensifer sp. LC54]OCP28704.1 hypothetical protein BC363_02365 [Ensifer sp. LC384]